MTQDVHAGAYAAKPWLALYEPHIAPNQAREHGDMLNLYRSALTDPSASALIYFDAEITYGEVDAMSDALAAWMSLGGVETGDRVTIILQNVPHFVIAMVAAWKIGAIPTPANPMYRRDELAKLFADSRASLVIAHDDQAATALAGLEAAGVKAAVLSVSARDFQTRDEPRVLTPSAPTPEGATDFMSAIRGHTGAVPPRYSPHPDDLGLLLYTSPTHIGARNRRPPVDPVSGAMSIGTPIQDTEAMIVGDDGKAMPVGEVGEVWMRGPQIMAGYWNKPEQTAEALVDGWMRSGDVGFMNADGWFYLVDRKKDMISASGFKVWPREVEDVLVAHPAIREAAVIGEPDAYRGETVAAFVSFKPGASASLEDIVAHCRERLAAYKVPRRVEVMEELPKTLTGKIQRVELRGK